jgi:thiamine kinase-like enzyme
MNADSWRVEPLVCNELLTAGIWRVVTPEGSFIAKRLNDRSGAPSTPWHAHITANAQVPHHWSYWAREVLAYETSLPTAYAGSSIEGPSCLVVDRRADRAELWLEDVDGRPGEEWDLDDYRAAAEALGRAQAEFLTERPLPDHHWLSRRFLREYSVEKPVNWSLLDDDSAWAQPLVRDHFPPELRAGARDLHARREELYAVSEALPRTLCHLDFWPKNLFRKADGTIIAIDWGFAGDGSIGEDIGNLILDTVFDHFQPAAQLPILEAAVLEAHVAGLRGGGWRGDPKLVRLGMCASAVKYDWLTPLMLTQAGAERQLAYGGREAVDAAHRFTERGHALAFTARWAREALRLARDIGLVS